MDNRYPHLRPVSELGYDRRAKDVQSLVREVCKRTDTRCMFNRNDGTLYFYRNDITTGMWTEPCKRREDGFLILESGDADRLCQTLNYSKATKQQKESWRMKREMDEEYKGQSEIDRGYDERFKEAEALLARRSGRRTVMGST